MPLLISNEVAEHVLKMADCVEVMEAAIKAEGLGTATNRTKAAIYIPAESNGEWYRYCSMEGGIRDEMVVAYRVKSDITGIEQGRLSYYCIKPGLYCGLILLFSARTGELLAILNDGVVQHMRVAATNGVGARYVARRESSVLGILGSGGLARAHALAYAYTHPLRLIKVFSPNVEHRSLFAREMSEVLGLAVEPCAKPEEVVRGSDIVATCTNAACPVLMRDWLEPGMHISTVTHYELSPNDYDRIDRFVKYRSGTSTHHFTTPENYRPPSLKGSGSDTERLEARITSTYHLAKVITGKIPGRTHDYEITLFHSEGTGVQFAAVAYLTYQKAKEKCLGQDLPLEWFLQTIKD